MTDEHEHDMPTAGRKPLPADDGDEPTRLLSGEGPTVETPRRSLLDPVTVDLEGPTRRLSVPSPDPVSPAAAPDPDAVRIPPAEPPAAPETPPVRESPFATLPDTPPAAPEGERATHFGAHETPPGRPEGVREPFATHVGAHETPPAASEGVRETSPAGADQEEAEPPGVVREKAAREAAQEAGPRPAAGFLRLIGKRPASPAGLLILALLALFGFTLVVQLRSNDGDEGLSTARQEDLVRILSDLEARDARLQSEISALETSQRQLTSGVAGRQAALDEAAKRADELGLLSGTLPGRGPGLRIQIDGVKASALLNTVQELRGAGGEVMQISGAGGQAVRIVASSYFVDAEGGGVIVDGDRLTGPYVLTVIGVPQVMQTALQIPGGVVASVNSGGGSVTLEQRTLVEVTAVRDATTLQYARPAS